jgi:hypothetical protein
MRVGFQKGSLRAVAGRTERDGQGCQPMRVSGDRPPHYLTRSGRAILVGIEFVAPASVISLSRSSFAPGGVQRLMELKKQGLHGSTQTG